MGTYKQAKVLLPLADKGDHFPLASVSSRDECCGCCVIVRQEARRCFVAPLRRYTALDIHISVECGLVVCSVPGGIAFWRRYRLIQASARLVMGQDQMRILL